MSSPDDEEDDYDDVGNGMGPLLTSVSLHKSEPSTPDSLQQTADAAVAANADGNDQPVDLSLPHHQSASHSSAASPTKPGGRSPVKSSSPLDAVIRELQSCHGIKAEPKMRNGIISHIPHDSDSITSSTECDSLER